MKVHHVGYFVSNIDEAREGFLKMGWHISSPCVFDELRKIFVQFLESDGSPSTGGGIVLELVAAGEGCTLFNKKMRSLGNAPYHICYECRDLDETIAEFRLQNFLLVREPQPACALENRRIAFMYGTSVGLIELLECKGEMLNDT